MKEWISVKDRLPEIKEGRHGVSVLVAVFDPIYEEINPGRGYSIQNHVWDGKNFLTLVTSMGEYKLDFFPSCDPVTHWMYKPDPPTKTLNGPPVDREEE